MKYNLPISCKIERFGLPVDTNNKRQSVPVLPALERFDLYTGRDGRSRTVPVRGDDQHDLYLAVSIYLYPHADWDKSRLADIDDMTLFDLSYKLL